MKQRKIVVDTDIILEHLTVSHGPSVLRRLMGRFFCYTTAFNAIEAFSVARGRKEAQAVDEAMSALKVLGLNAKSSKTIGGLFAEGKSRRRKDLPFLIAGICVESKLPIVTMNPRRFSGIKGVRVIPVRRVQ